MELDSKGKAKEKVCAKALAGDQENERDRKRLQKGKGNFLANNSIVLCGVWTDSNFTLILFSSCRVVSWRDWKSKLKWNEMKMRWDGSIALAFQLCCLPVFLYLTQSPLFHSPSLSVCLSFTGNESFSLCSVAGDLPLLLALLPGTFWGQFESRRESDTQSNRARGRGSSGNGGKCSRNADQGEGDQAGIEGQGLWGSRAGPLAGNQFAIVTVTVTESPST